MNEGALHGLFLIMLAICIPGILLSFIYTEEPNNLRNRKITIVASIVLLVLLYFPLNNYIVFSDAGFIVSSLKLQKTKYKYSDISNITVYPSEKSIINENNTRTYFLVPQVDMRIINGKVYSLSKLDDFKLRQIVNYDDLKKVITVLNEKNVNIIITDIEGFQKVREYKESRSYKEIVKFYDFLKTLE